MFRAARISISQPDWSQKLYTQSLNEPVLISIFSDSTLPAKIPIGDIEFLVDQTLVWGHHKSERRSNPNDWYREKGREGKGWWYYSLRWKTMFFFDLNRTGPASLSDIGMLPDYSDHDPTHVYGKPVKNGQVLQLSGVLVNDKGAIYQTNTRGLGILYDAFFFNLNGFQQDILWKVDGVNLTAPDVGN